MEEGRGDFIDGAFRKVRGAHDDGAAVQSRDPSRDFAPVFRAATSIANVDAAVDAAKKAQSAWAALGVDGRKKHLVALKAAFDEHAEKMARAITREMGKPIREANAEAKSLGERIPLVLDESMKRVATRKPDGVPGEERAHPQGVLGVIGPYNYPAHLVN